MEPTESNNSEQLSALAPNPRRDARWVFLGPHGIRAGWSLAIFIAFVFTLFFLFGAVFQRLPHQHLAPGSPLPPMRALLAELAQVVVVLAATFVMSRLEQKPVLAYGLQGRARAVRFFSGLVWGFIAISVLVLTLWKLGYLAFDGRALAGPVLLKDALLWGAVFFLTGVFEESLFRGYIQFTLNRGIGFWWGAILVAALFAFAHTSNTGESRVGLVSVIGASLIFCLSLWYTGSLWWAIGFHATWDWGQSFFYGTADSGMVARGHLFNAHPVGSILLSGGATGPEGSLFVVPVLFILAVAMFLWWGRRVRSPFTGAAWRPVPPATDAVPNPMRPALGKFTLS